MSRQLSENEPREGATQSYAVPALEKALDVLELLSNAQKALGLNEIAEALNRSRPELFRVMVCLHNRGYLLRDGRLYLSLMADGGIYAWEPDTGPP